MLTAQTTDPRPPGPPTPPCNSIWESEIPRSPSEESDVLFQWCYLLLSLFVHHPNSGRLLCSIFREQYVAFQKRRLFDQFLMHFAIQCRFTSLRQLGRFFFFSFFSGARRSRTRQLFSVTCAACPLASVDCAIEVLVIGDFLVCRVMKSKNFKRLCVPSDTRI